MGCVQVKPSRVVQSWKTESGPIKLQVVGGGEKKKIENVNFEKEGPENTTAICDDIVDGWPKWLLANVPKHVFAGLLPKSADCYHKLAKIGEGTYSNVYKAQDRDTGKIVALKKVRFDTSEPESVQFMAREIIILRQLDHPNIIKLEGIATSRVQYSLYLVFDYMDTDLCKVISRLPGKLTEPQVKCYMQQLLSGLMHCHERGILHRDIKSSNLLINTNGMLKIADFGLASFFKPKQKRPLTSCVVTLWYRAPELLLGSTDYGVGVDLWSVGCLLAEMFVGKPILAGRTEVEQLHRIFKLCGSPSEEYWKKMKPSTMFGQPEQYKPSFQGTFSKTLPLSSFNLLTSLLALEPALRGTATSSLQDEFFSLSPLACGLSDLPVIVKEEDELSPTANQRKGIYKLKKKAEEKNGNQKLNVSFPIQVEEELESFDQENNAQPNLKNQETFTIASTTSADEKRLSMNTITDTHTSLPPSPFSAFRLNQNRIAKTQAHPNAMNNIQNFPLLLASMADGGNPIMIQDNQRLALNRKSRSNVDFRTIDLDSISKLFGMPD